MPLDPPLAPVSERVAELNSRYRHHSAHDVLEHALSDPLVGRMALVSSFGAESVALLHMVSVLDRTTPVLFLDTEMLFPETLAYQVEVTESLGLSDVRIIRPAREDVFARDPDGILHLADPNACCELRKREPLQRALGEFDSWATGRKRFQTDARAGLEFFEDEEGQRIKVNPLVHWAREDVAEYILNNRLPRHPLVKRGYPSLGCIPCTAKVEEGDEERSGRWRGFDKDECGIHFVDGKPVPGPDPEEYAHVIVSDAGFGREDWEDFDAANVLDLTSDTDPVSLRDQIGGIDMIRIDFPSFADGRGFTIARQLRLMGYRGRLRASGHLISDQYAMARRAGFDEIEISRDLARRQPEADWAFRANWQAFDYQARLRGQAAFAGSTQRLEGAAGQAPVAKTR